MADTIKSSIHINPADTRISEDGLRLIKEWVLKKIRKVSADLKYTANLVVPSVDQLPEEGNPEYVYMVGPLPDSADSDGLYDVYAWIEGEYEKLTTLNNSMVGFWKGSPAVEGEGNVVTGIELINDGNTVVVSKGINALVKEDISELESNIAEIRGYISPAAREDNKLTDKEYVDNQIGTLSASIPTKTSELTNDSKFITLNDIPPVQMDGKTIIGSGTDESPFSAAVLKGATESAEGSSGIVPAPTVADRGRFLKGDGTWDTPENSTYTAKDNGGLVLTGSEFSVDTGKYYDKTEIDAKLSAHADFSYSSYEELKAAGDAAHDPSKVYYIRKTASPDSYDVYVWPAGESTTDFELVDESSISLDGRWVGKPTITGPGNAFTNIEKNADDSITITKGETFAKQSELPQFDYEESTKTLTITYF